MPVKTPKLPQNPLLDMLNLITPIRMFAWINRVIFMRHILSFVIFVELLVVEVNYLEFVIGRLRAASRRDRGGSGLCKTCP